MGRSCLSLLLTGEMMSRVQKEKKIRVVFVLWMAVCAVLLLFGFVGNTVLFERKVSRIGKEYIRESNEQLSAHILERLRFGREFVTEFADALSRMPEFLLTEELLDRKQNVFQLADVMILYEDGTTFPESGETAAFEQWMEENPQIWKNPEISYIKNDRILFSAPIPGESGSRRVVVGSQYYEELKTLSNLADYQEYAVSILMNEKNQEVITLNAGSGVSSKDEEISYVLEQLKNRGTCSQTVYEEKLPSGSRIHVAVCRLGESGWTQVAMIPSDFLMKQVQTEVKLYFLFALILSVVFGIVIYSQIRANRISERMLHTDSLTDGFNREGFLRAAGELLEKEKESAYSVVYLNVKNFRYINESWGEEDGNKTLIFIYKELQKMVKPQELAARSSMDHFFLLLDEATDCEIEERIRRVEADINNRIRNRFGKYSLEFSVGAYRMEDDNEISQAMNKAMHASRLGEEKHICSFYQGAIAEQISRENHLNALFDESLRNHDFYAYLQPKVSAGKEKCCEAEALVRWIHPREGMIYPSDFIPVLERNGKICSLDLYIFEEICRLIQSWISQGKPVTRISVNLSRFHIRNVGSDIWKKYQEIKERYQIPDGILEIELTETALLESHQFEFVKQVLDGFRRIGMSVALDDFGFAYSSLSLLKDLEVDTLKLDRTFFLNESERSRSIVRNVIGLAHSFHINVVAEGIETMEQVDALRRMDCDFIQGYVYSRPISADEFEAWREQYEK